MGAVNIPLKALFSSLGCQVVQGPSPNRKTAEAGIALAPEMVCLPFKITLGDMISCLERGADTLLFLGDGDWSCRFGYYGRVQYHILEKQGYQFKALFVSFSNAREIMSEFLKLSNGNILKLLYRSIRGCILAYNKSKLVELAEELSRESRPRECRTGESSRVMRSMIAEIDRACTISKLLKLRKRIIAAFKRIELHSDAHVLRILIIGESYCVVESFVNFNLIEFLGEQGVCAEPFLTSHRWLIRHSIRKEEDRHCTKKKAITLAKKYWKYGTGGEDQIEIGYMIHAIESGIDGVIHLMPFGCMPETAALPVLEQIASSKGIPMLNLSLDEHSGVSGIQTRIEAFSDLLKERTRKPALIKEHM